MMMARRFSDANHISFCINNFNLTIMRGDCSKITDVLRVIYLLQRNICTTLYNLDMYMCIYIYTCVTATKVD